MKVSARTARAHETDLIESELAELGEECARVLILLRRLARARAAARGTGAILGELGAVVIHLHAHTKGLDKLIDRLPSD